MCLIIFNILDKLKSKIVTGYSSKRHSFLVFDEVRITSYHITIFLLLFPHLSAYLFVELVDESDEGDGSEL